MLTIATKYCVCMFGLTMELNQVPKNEVEFIYSAILFVFYSNWNARMRRNNNLLCIHYVFCSFSLITYSCEGSRKFLVKG
ncbi:hypothetical protein GDO78_001490 [Eleutherodactylus coqui]|uniref:Uncharacterized protein n=1 Tax=Eleutherodactylus coqui TaxID=57060 RepID=A0A8J6FVW4_ELECQ|nr:hypothetical protein GDO78_001490 [Eleutherodactylus coqui]